MELPNDPVILLSYMNTQLRDFYPSLEEFCASTNTDIKDITERLHAIEYEYNHDRNQFI